MTYAERAAIPHDPKDYDCACLLCWTHRDTLRRKQKKSRARRPKLIS